VPDHIGQACLPLSFHLVNATSIVHSHVPVAIVPHRRTIANDLAHTLAYKVLQMPVFSFVEMMALNFIPVQVFHLVSNMLEQKLPMPFLEVAQAITEPSSKEDLVML